MHIAVALLRLSEGLDYENAEEDQESQKKNPSAKIPSNQSFTQLSQGKIYKIILLSKLNKCLTCKFFSFSK